MRRLREVARMYQTCGDIERIARKLQRINEICRVKGLSKNQIKRKIELRNKINDLADELGLRAVHQDDPREKVVYLVAKSAPKIPEKWTEKFYLKC